MQFDFGTTGRILVVEDEAVARAMLVKTLSDRGHEVRVVVSGAEALLEAGRYHPDLILIDIDMPGMGGFDVCQQLKADPRTALIPVVFFGATESERDRLRAFDIGGADFIAKPFHPREILARVDTHLTLRALLRQQRTFAAQLDDQSDLAGVTLRESENRLPDESAERQRVEAALRESEQRYRAVAEDTPAMICRSLPDGTVTYVNEACCQCFGTSREELEGQSFYSMLPEADLEKVHADRMSLTPEEPMRAVEHQIIMPDGELHWQRWTNRALFDDEGRVVAFQAIGNDITDAKRVEEQLRWEGRVNAAIAELSRRVMQRESVGEVASDVLNVACELTDSRVGFTAHLDPQRGELVRPTFVGEVWDRCKVRGAPSVFKRARGLWRHVLDAKEPFFTNDPRSDAASVGTPPGHVDVRRFLAVPGLAGGEVVGLIALANAPRDYEQRDLEVIARICNVYVLAVSHQYAVEALQRNEERYALAQRAANIGSWDLDVATGRLEWSEEIEPMFGFGPGGFGRTYEAFVECIHPDDRQFVQDAVDEALGGGREYDIEHRIIWPDGSVRWLSEKADIFRDESGRAVRMIGVVRDITGQKRAEEERRRLQEQLLQSQKLEAIGQLAGSIAHDFNNLLTVILSNARMLEDGHVKPDMSRQMVGLIREAGEQAAEVTRSLLTFSRKVPSKRTRIEICEVMRRVTNLLRRMMPAAVELVIEIRDDPLWVLADPTQVQQIVMNLAINARDAMPDGGTLRIALKLDPGRRRAVQIVVSDTGVGMTEEVRARAFEPFFTTKPRGRGTGLGLSMIHGIVEEHGGRITLDSAPGKGTTFVISLPRADQPTDHELAEVPFETPLGDGELVLVAEDDDHVRQMLTATLTQLGYRVIESRDGEELIAHYEAHGGEAQLVIVDVDMPKRGGLECIRLIRRECAHQPIIVTTGDLRPEGEGQIEPGVALIRKPFVVSRLAGLIRDLIGEGRAGPAPA